MVPESPIVGRDVCAAKGMRLLLAVGANKVTEAGAVLYVVLELKAYVELMLLSELVRKLEMKLVLKVKAEVVVEQVVSLAGERASVVALAKSRVEDIPLGVGRIVVVSVISVSETLGASKPIRLDNFRCERKRLVQ